jgi:type VI secretion system secreted protein VgrG
MAGATVLPEVGYAFTAGPVNPQNATVVHVYYREALNDLYECAVILAVPLTLSPESMVTQAATLELTRLSLKRNVRGVVRRVEDVGNAGQYRFVRAFVVPRLWILSKRMDSRIFQNKKTVEIIEEVLRDAQIYQGGGFAPDAGLFSPAPREYCVQHHETDLAFVRRLLEDEGVPFYFKHDSDEETWVLCDDSHAYAPAPALETPIQVIDENMGTAQAETLHWFDAWREAQTTKVTLRDYDFTRPRATQDMTPSQGDGVRAVYEYPTRATITNYNEGGHVYTTHNSARLAKVRLEEHATREGMARGESNVIGVAPGFTVQVGGHVHSEFDKKYLVAAAEHVGQSWTSTTEDVSLGPKLMQMLQMLNAELIDTVDEQGRLPERYRNRLVFHRAEGLSTSVPYRPARVTPRPIVEGPQTARVVGPPGEEIHVDFYGRIKVQFHWDRLGQENQNSSCWIRTAQNWAGGGWGFVFIPRIGMEVVVTFLEGDPDRPLVTGCVYNGENHPPYELPREKTKSTIKTNTSPSNGGYNELRFEDLRGQEQVYMQAERNHDVLVKKDQTITVGNDRTKTVTGNEFISVRKNRTSTITQNDKLTVTQNHEIEVQGDTGFTTDVDHTWRLEAGDRIILKCGDSTIIMTPQGIWLNGPVVKLNCSDKPQV